MGRTTTAPSDGVTKDDVDRVVAEAEKATAAAAKPKLKTVKVGPLACRFADVPDDARAKPIPTVESIAETARTSFLTTHAEIHNRFGNRVEGQAFYAAVMTPKATRGAAQSAVNVQHLRPAGRNARDTFTKAQLQPLVTAVRKQLLATLRVEKKAAAKRERDRAREQAKTEAAQRKARERALAKARRECKAVILPKGVKPTKGTASGTTLAPALFCGHVQKVGRGESARWTLYVTDSYSATLIDLDVTNPTAIRECVIPAEALKAIEKAGAFRITAKGIQPLSIDHLYDSVPSAGFCPVPRALPVGSGYVPTEGMRLLRVGEFKDAKPPKRVPIGTLPLPTEPPASRRLELTLDASRLEQLQRALGQPNVTVVLDLAKFAKGEDGVRSYRCEGKAQPIRVEPRKATNIAGVRAHLMPVRSN